MAAMGRRRTPGARRRAGQQAERFGSEVSLARATLGLTVQQAAHIAGVAWETQVRAEAGDPGLSVTTMCAIGDAVGIDVVVRTYPGRPPSLHDTGQLTLAEQLRAEANPAWQLTIELLMGEHGEAIDVALFGASEIIAIEIERLTVNWQAQFCKADSKRAILAAQHQRPVRLVMAIEDTQRNRRALAPHLEVIRLALPAGSRDVLRALRTGEPLGRDGLLWIRRRST